MLRLPITGKSLAKSLGGAVASWPTAENRFFQIVLLRLQVAKEACCRFTNMGEKEQAKIETGEAPPTYDSMLQPNFAMEIFNVFAEFAYQL